ncbi:MAG TPA: ComF family protein [Rhodocyclaceae bacterium]|nr:ComF family protein [Rhodocyclaceae bacterium]
MSNWHKLGKAVLATLFPQSCLLCGAGVDAASADAVCQNCRDALPRIDVRHCPVCALPTADAHICGSCLKTPPHFDATHARYRYAFPLNHLLQHYKYGQALSVSALFNHVVTAKIDAVLAVPSTPSHLKERGFNPALELARPLAKRMQVPLLLHAVTRPKDAPAQAGLPWKARRKNIRNAFECHADLSGRSILVVDDVMTTGATLDELARTLKRHGATRVENCVVARALKDD